MTTTSEQQAVPVAQVDWRTIAKAAGEYGVRYRTNTALLAFLDAIEPARKADRFDAARLTPIEGVAASELPVDVRALVIAAREFWDDNNDQSDESTALDKALEAFSSRVPYDGEPTPSPAIPEGTSGERVEAIGAVAWRCYHCGDVFTSDTCARLHFGRDEDSQPACQIKAGAEQGLLSALRDAEYAAADAQQAVANECTDAAKAYYAQATRHNQAMRNAEELGYERGLADGRALTPEATHTREAALKPFAEAAGDYDYHDGTPAMREYPDDSSLPELNDLTIGDLRRARAALSAGAAKGEAR